MIKIDNDDNNTDAIDIAIDKDDIYDNGYNVDDISVAD
jgi:hypothetical protein